MKAFYDDGTVTIYHGDCLTMLELLDSADVLLTDPPYGIRYASNQEWATAHHRFRGKQIQGDDSTAARDVVLERWGNVKPAMVVMAYLELDLVEAA